MQTQRIPFSCQISKHFWFLILMASNGAICTIVHVVLLDIAPNIITFPCFELWALTSHSSHPEMHSNLFILFIELTTHAPNEENRIVKTQNLVWGFIAHIFCVPVSWMEYMNTADSISLRSAHTHTFICIVSGSLALWLSGKTNNTFGERCKSQ